MAECISWYTLPRVDWVAGTSLDDVGSAAGVGRSQLYHYFSDKGELVRAVIARVTDDVLDAQEPYRPPRLLAGVGVLAGAHRRHSAAAQL